MKIIFTYLTVLSLEHLSLSLYNCLKFKMKIKFDEVDQTNCRNFNVSLIKVSYATTQD